MQEVRVEESENIYVCLACGKWREKVEEFGDAACAVNARLYKREDVKFFKTGKVSRVVGDPIDEKHQPTA